MISLKENGLSVFPQLSEKETKTIEAETSRLVKIIVDIICGNSVSFGQYKKVESLDDLRITERIFLQTYHIKWDSELEEDKIYGIRNYAGNRFLSYSCSSPNEQPVTMMSAKLQSTFNDDERIPAGPAKRCRVGASLSFFLPDSLENISDEVIYSYFFYWIDTIVTFKIAKEIGLEDHIHTGYENPISIIVDNDVANPNFIKFFVDYYSMVFRIFDDVTDGSLNPNFKCGNEGESKFWWDNLGGFIANLKNYNDFGLLDPDDYHILNQKDLKIRLKYDKLTCALYTIAKDPYTVPYFEVARMLVDDYDKELLYYISSTLEDMDNAYHEEGED